MSKAAKAHTDADKERFRRLGEMGCIVCRIAHGAFVQSEVAHVTDCGRRVGHQATIPLCPWHHRAVCSGDIPPKEMTRIYGPSFAKSKRDFVAAFGTESDLLEQTDQWLGLRRDPDLSKFIASPSPPLTTAESAQVTPLSKAGSVSSSAVSSRSPPKKNARRSLSA